MADYTYISSINYIDGWEFDYIETYSLQRGTAFEESRKLILAEFNELKLERRQRNELTTEGTNRYLELESLLEVRQYLVNDRGQFHWSAQKTNTFSVGDPVVDKLYNILRTPIKEMPSWICAPVYRDAIVFYKENGAIVSALNVCLGCDQMETKKLTHINADFRTYELLKKFFIEAGHEVEE